jgi:hypothetical protein
MHKRDVWWGAYYKGGTCYELCPENILGASLEIKQETNNFSKLCISIQVFNM